MTVISLKMTREKVDMMSQNVDNSVDNVDFCVGSVLNRTELSTSYEQVLKVLKCINVANTQLVKVVM